ncbi:MAG: ABC transporter ATP-binding protein [Chloroflexi bacterium]|jgi:ABC-type lipoprotein export system ATPase subunit|nr:ABC transporter ATP-binding protein [Chloroflexota bacterium]
MQHEVPGASGHAPAILCENLVKIYKVAELEVVALQGLDLAVEPAEIVAVVGASGSGKSTLMNILGGLDEPTAGRAVVAGHDLARMRSRERTEYRRRVVGFVWQQTARNLVPYLSAVENVELPMLLAGVAGEERATRAAALLDLVGLDDRRALLPGRLAGGEQQRVAVAVALANRPRVLLADEPTGELDTESASQLFEALRRVNRELRTTIVLVTHDPLVAEHVGRTVAIRDGRTSTETLRRSGVDAGGLVEEEFAVLDRAGRLQLPRAHVEALGLHRRVRLRLEGDHIGIWPDDGGAARAPAMTAPSPGAPPPGASPGAPPPGASPGASPGAPLPGASPGAPEPPPPPRAPQRAAGDEPFRGGGRGG